MSDLIGKMRNTVQFCINNPTAQGAGNVDNYGILLTTRGYLRKRSGGRSLQFAEIEGQSSFTLTTRYQSAIAASISISTKIIIDNIWHTITSWEKKEEVNFYYEFQLNRTEPVSGVIPDLTAIAGTGLQDPLYLQGTAGETTLDTGIGNPVIVLVARSGLLYKKVDASPGAFEYTVADGVLTFGLAFNAGEFVYVLYKLQS